MSGPADGARPRRLGPALRGACVLAAGAAAGFLAYFLTRPVPTRAVLMSVPAPATQIAAPAETASPARTIPADLPPIALPDPSGRPRSLAEFRGRPLLVNFWATWCEPCRREIPLLKQLRHENSQDGLEIVGIAVDYRDAVAKYVEARKIDYPILIGEQGGLEAATALGMDVVLPFSVFADRDGRIITVKVGELHADEARLILGLMHAVDHGQLPLPAAREQIATGISRLNAARAATSPPQS